MAGCEQIARDLAENEDFLEITGVRVRTLGLNAETAKIRCGLGGLGDMEGRFAAIA